MAIPESQLETWSHQGAVTGSSTTYNHIKNTLEDRDSPYASKNFSVFLQGSYGNDTNIYSESDVDIVIQLNDTFKSDTSALSTYQKEIYSKAFSAASYTLSDFKADVLSVLTSKYGNPVKEGSKAIAIPASVGRRKADVIVAMQYRRYHKFNGEYDQNYDEGICFYTSNYDEIVNYPKQHRANLTTKHQSSNKWLKPMVRVLKNLRGKLVDEGMITAGVAPSYYLEGLLYNVPDFKLTSSYQDCFVNAMNWIQDDADKDKLLCANEQYYLLRDFSHVCWPRANCDQFLSAATELWNDW